MKYRSELLFFSLGSSHLILGRIEASCTIARTHALGFAGGMQINKSPQSNAVSGVPSGPVQQQTNPSTNNTATPQGMPSSSNNNQQAGPQTNAGTPNTNMNNS